MVQNNPIAQPLVSVICYCRNASKTIGRCINSILAQDYPNIEVIVQDGESTDGTLDILHSYGRRIDLVSESDDGPGDAMFRCIRRASGDIFVTCLADEVLLSHAVSWGVEQLLSHPEAGAVYGDHYNIDLDGNITGIVRPQPWDFTKMLCSEFIPPFCTSFFRSVCFAAVGLKEYNDCGEFEIWLRIGAKYPVIYIPGLLSKYGVHDGALSFQLDQIQDQARGKRNVLKTFFEEPGLPAELIGLKQEAENSIHTWLVNSYCNMGDWDRACDYFRTACVVDRNLKRAQAAGMRLLNHGLGLIKDGDIVTAKRYIDLPLHAPYAFQGLDLASLQIIRKRFLNPDELTKEDSVKGPTNSTNAVPDHCELDRLIPPEIQNGDFYEEIKRLAAQNGIEHILEIGSSAGEGSTDAFVSGMQAGGHGAKLFCIEISAPRYQRLQNR
jgi:glycosyltransferase involved in cell wall biosynthesis